MRRPNYFWRLTGTAICFSTFGIGGLILAIFVFPTIYAVVRSKQARAAISQRIVKRSFGAFVSLINILGVFNVRIHGGHKLADDHGTIIISNHPSLIDVVILISLIDRAQCIVKRAVWTNPFMKGVVAAAGYIPNDDDPEELIKRCVASLRAGNNLVIFPEGSRTLPRTPLKLKRGVANIALRAKAPIRIATIVCRPTTLTKHEKWYQIPSVKADFDVTIHDKINVDEYGGRRSVECRRLTQRLTGLLVELSANGKTGRSNSAPHYRGAES